MKISMNVEADSINVLSLNMGKTAVEVYGVEMDELINVVNDNGYTLRIANTPGEIKKLSDDALRKREFGIIGAGQLLKRLNRSARFLYGF